MAVCLRAKDRFPGKAMGDISDACVCRVKLLEAKGGRMMVFLLSRLEDILDVCVLCSTNREEFKGFVLGSASKTGKQTFLFLLLQISQGRKNVGRK